ncbi:MAG: hypothetical protein LC769_12290 [Chloroflexi bacterium]|nr:hypothetical protein [Chloroflexota bacterium]
MRVVNAGLYKSVVRRTARVSCVACLLLGLAPLVNPGASPVNRGSALLAPPGGGFRARRLCGAGGLVSS